MTIENFATQSAMYEEQLAAKDRSIDALILHNRRLSKALEEFTELYSPRVEFNSGVNYDIMEDRLVWAWKMTPVSFRRLVADINKVSPVTRYIIYSRLYRKLLQEVRKSFKASWEEMLRNASN